jgi:hypothetical protein
VTRITWACVAASTQPASAMRRDACRFRAGSFGVNISQHIRSKYVTIRQPCLPSLLQGSARRKTSTTLLQQNGDAAARQKIPTRRLHRPRTPMRRNGVEVGHRKIRMHRLHRRRTPMHPRVVEVGHRKIQTQHPRLQKLRRLPLAEEDGPQRLQMRHLLPLRLRAADEDARRKMRPLLPPQFQRLRQAGEEDVPKKPQKPWAGHRKTPA